MKPYISRGDVVLVDKIDTEDHKNLKKGDILAFKQHSKIIVHRIYKIIQRGDNVYFVTKGDNNNQADQGIIEPGDVVGKVLLKVKKIGLPSIWLNDLFK